MTGGIGLGGQFLDQRAVARRAWGVLAPYSRRMALAALCAIVQALLVLVPVLVFRALIGHLTRPHPGFTGVAVLLGLGVLALLAAGLAFVAANVLATQIAENVVHGLRQELYEHLLSQPVAFFTKRRSGEVLSALINDVEGIENVLTDSLLDLIRDGCLLVALVVLMFVLDWRLAVLTLLVVPVLVLGFRYTGQRVYRAQLHVQAQLSEVTAFLQETLGLSGLMLVKAFARETVEARRFASLNDGLRQRQLAAAMATRWLVLGMTMLQAVAPVILLLIGGLLITRGSAPLGTVLAFSTIIAGQFATSAGTLGRATLSVIGSLAMWSRVFDVLDHAPELAERPDAASVADVRGTIALDHVTFAYPDTSAPALRDISVEIGAGQLVALVGPSGAGKSTFSALIARFIDPQLGSVTLDGVDLRALTLRSLHRSIGVVFQDAFLFHATLRENLRYGRPGASDDEVGAAVREANLERFIQDLPHGLDSVVGERGYRLSGGEKQRVAIARVLLENPPILLLDEATAHLDTVSERLIQDALRRLFVGRTSLVIAHRLSTVISADLILVLDGGVIVERGRHDDLMEADGLYARLHSSALISGEPEMVTS